MDTSGNFVAALKPRDCNSLEGLSPRSSLLGILNVQPSDLLLTRRNDAQVGQRLGLPSKETCEA